MGRILVLGAGGMLGHKICQRLRGHEVIGLVRREAAAYDAFPEVFAGVRLIGGVDVLRSEDLESTVREIAPRAVVNCVGLVKQLEEAEDPYLAVAINAYLPHRLARLCAELGARLVHVSTDCVFDGTRGAYRESDLTDAVDLYGRSKALGETGERESAAVTLRTSFVGRELTAPRHGLLEWFLAQDGGRVVGFDRVIYSGLTSIELSRVVQRVVDADGELHGLYQVAGAPVSKYELLRLVRRIYDLDVEIEKAAEPVCDRSLSADAFSQALGYVAPTWEEMIHQVHLDPTPYGGAVHP